MIVSYTVGNKPVFYFLRYGDLWYGVTWCGLILKQNKNIYTGFAKMAISFGRLIQQPYRLNSDGYNYTLISIIK